MTECLVHRRKPLRWRTGAAVLRGVIFDLDGVLVGTDRVHFAAWGRLAGELGLPFDEEINDRLRGVAREESLRIIYRCAGRDSPARRGRRWRSSARRRMRITCGRWTG